MKWKNGYQVVINHKTTKFESNSQHWLYWVVLIAMLLSITKLQNLKAIHNEDTNGNGAVGLLSITKLQNLKAIHNSSVSIAPSIIVVINHKATKFESNSQLMSFSKYCHSGCYQSQNYKI